MDKALCFELIFRGLRDKYGEAQVIPMFNFHGLGHAFDGWDEAKHPRDIAGRFANKGEENMLQERFKADENSPIPPIAEFLGEEFKGYKGQEAVNKLLQEQRGHIKAAFHRDDIGDITLAWGNEDGGLCHLLMRRSQDKKVQELNAFVSDLAEVIEKGNAYKNKKYMSRINLWYNGKIVVLDTDYDGQKFNWVVTGFVKRNEPKR